MRGGGSLLPIRQACCTAGTAGLGGVGAGRERGGSGSGAGRGGAGRVGAGRERGGAGPGRSGALLAVLGQALVACIRGSQTNKYRMLPAPGL